MVRISLRNDFENKINIVIVVACMKEILKQIVKKKNIKLSFSELFG